MKKWNFRPDGITEALETFSDDGEDALHRAGALYFTKYIEALEGIVDKYYEKTEDPEFVGGLEAFMDDEEVRWLKPMITGYTAEEMAETIRDVLDDVLGPSEAYDLVNDYLTNITRILNRILLEDYPPDEIKAMIEMELQDITWKWGEHENFHG